MSRVFAIIIAYCLGSISPSIIQGRLKGVDIKKEGSGNAGTTNTLRVLGKKAAVITLAADILKAVLAVMIGKHFDCAYLCAVAAIAGHIWPVYYGFKGGKGVASAFGAVLAICPKTALSAFALVVAAVLLSRKMSVGSIAGAASLPLFSLVFCKSFALYGLAIAAVIIFKHKSNVARLIKGEEPNISFLNEVYYSDRLCRSHQYHSILFVFY